MDTQLNLKELERKAFRSTYQDGLLDLYTGLIVVCMSIFVYRPLPGYSLLNIVFFIAVMIVAQALFWVGKKYITLPRMGQVHFGEQRKKRTRIMVIVMSAMVLVQAILFALTLLIWANPEWSARIKGLLPERGIMDLLVASFGSLMVGLGMNLVAYFKDFPRGYFMAIMISIAVFLMLYLNQPIYPIIIGILIAIPGLVLFVRFLQKYPLPQEEKSHG
jgi:hypothetical protein